MQKVCKECSVAFEITTEDIAFYDRISPVFHDKKYSIPPPTLCPDCRIQRRFSFRNERKLYRRKCDLTNQDCISFHCPEKPQKVYRHQEWWTDQWNGFDYGSDFDFSRKFFEQFQELQAIVPRLSMQISHCENSDYAPYSVYSKNCYACVSCIESEDLYYSYQTNNSRNAIDCSLSFLLELCYECLFCSNLFGSACCQNCEESRNLFFCQDCKGCADCIGCKNLINKKHYIFNKPVSNEQFLQFQQKLSSHQKQKEFSKAANDFFLSQPQRSRYLINCENCSGDHLTNCKNALFSFYSRELEDCKFVYIGARNAKDCHDLHYSPNSELVYDTVSGVNNYMTKFVSHSWDLKNAFYADECFYSHDIFGCIGLKHQKYCILNKQYSTEEYEELVPKIIEHMQKTGEWGEFFPIEISPFAYNETVAQEYFPLTKEEVLKRGWKWKEEEKPDFSGITKKIPANKLPDSIQEIPDDILNWAIECEESKRYFKIQKAELEFYRKMNLPIPHYHPDVRHTHRMQLRNPRKLWDRTCAKCNKPIQTTYSPDRPEIVYCEQCYLGAIY